MRVRVPPRAPANSFSSQYFRGQDAFRHPASVRGLIHAQVHPLDLVQKGGSLYQFRGYSNGAALPGLGGLPALDSIGGGVVSGAQPVVIQLDGPATTSLLRGEAVQTSASNPRLIRSAVMSASKSNSGRRELTSLQLSPGLVTS